MSEPLDVRLVPAAVAAWVAAALGVRGGGTRFLAGLGAMGALGAVLVVAVGVTVAAHALRGRRRGGERRGRRGTPRHVERAAAGRPASIVLVALAAAGAVVGSCAAQVAARDAAPAHRAAVEGAVVRAAVTVVEPPRAVGAAWGPGRLLVTARLEAMTWRGVSTRGTRAGELLLVGTPQVLGGLDAHGWGQGLALVGRLTPGTGREVGVLTVTRVESVTPAAGVAGVVARLRGGLARACAGLGPDARGLVPAMAVGDTSQVDSELSGAMRVAGLTHLVAVSGQHVAIVLLVVLATLAALAALPGLPVPRPAHTARPGRLAMAGAAALALAGFVTLVGPSPSVLRAAVMGAVAVLGIGAGRPARPVPGLCVAVVGLLVHDPWAAGALGFQLSVASTAAIVLLAGPAQRLLCRRLAARRPARWAPGRPGPRFLGLVLVPLAAQSAAAPLLVLVSPSVSAWAVPANVLAAPAVLPLTVLGLLALLLAGWPAAQTVVVHVAAVPAQWIGGVARAVATLPGASAPWRPGVAGAVGLAALVAAAWWSARLLLVPSSPRRRRARIARGRHEVPEPGARRAP